uniref:Anosmin-1-like n=1 Tax=Callorhinchus milii TaxID=7868 RepID=A0A4W3HXQ4_CALMI
MGCNGNFFLFYIFQCLQPCKELWDTDHNQCWQRCEVRKHHECLTSCEFLKSIQTVKQGNCPPPQRASGFAAACVQSCTTDTECPAARKCCPNGCGQTCQTPTHMFKGVPLKPRKELSYKEGRSGDLSVTWMSRFNVSMEPVFYILQRRWNSGIHPSEDEASEWETVAQTTKEHILLKDTQPSRWYQFRVAAVNVHGTRGYTTPSKHFHCSRDPSPPGAPRNVQKGNWTARHDGTFIVPIQWDPPREEDVAIHHYKVFWSQRLSRKGMLPVRRENWKITEGARNEVELEELLPNTDYLVQVQAVAIWGQKRLKSKKALLFFNTPVTGKGDETLQVVLLLPPSSAKEHSAPYYHGNQLQVKVYWNKAQFALLMLLSLPDYCEETHFIITGLLFACEYKVTVQPLLPQGQGAEVVTYVMTPQCSRRHPVSSPGSGKVTLRPERLTAAFIAVNGSVTGEFHWRVSLNQHLHQPVTGYQLNWTKVSTVNRPVTGPDILPDVVPAISQMQILPPNQPFMTIPNLQPSTLYQIKVQIMSTMGKGPATVKTFQIPQLAASPHEGQRILHSVS